MNLTLNLNLKIYFYKNLSFALLQKVKLRNKFHFILSNKIHLFISFFFFFWQFNKNNNNNLKYLVNTQVYYKINLNIYNDLIPLKLRVIKVD